LTPETAIKINAELEAYLKEHSQRILERNSGE